jgi:hypothetical protein
MKCSGLNRTRQQKSFKAHFLSSLSLSTYTKGGLSTIISHHVGCKKKKYITKRNYFEMEVKEKTRLFFFFWKKKMLSPRYCVSIASRARAKLQLLDPATFKILLVFCWMMPWSAESAPRKLKRKKRWRLIKMCSTHPHVIQSGTCLSLHTIIKPAAVL